ncbi:MAG: NosD domain-containing protein [Candidatus Anstonellales archaeon]
MRIEFIVLSLLVLLASTYAISDCQQITGENLSLTLDNNIDAQGNDCFYIQGINITLDCRNYLIYNASTAILVNNSHMINISRCKIENSTNGIILQVQTPTGYPEYQDQLVRRNTSAILTSITINNVTNGILMNRTHQNTIRFANIRNSQNAISLFYSYANIIENSTIQNNQLGIFIYDAAANGSQANATPILAKAKGKGVKSVDPEPVNDTTVIRGKYGSIVRHCTFQNNSIGIVLNQTANNSFYNNLFNNTQNVLSDSSSSNFVNYWNSSYDCSQRSIINGMCRGGNYWNDYYGYDDGTGSPPHDVYFDDIGDTLLPYIPNGEISGDELPLTKNLPPDWVAYCRQITQPGTYTQKRNIYGVISSSNKKCIEVLADNVTLNCAGFNITDNTTYTDSYGIYISNYNNLTVANCTVLNYTTGYYDRNSFYGALYRNNFSNDRYNLYFDVDTSPYPNQTEPFLKTITTDNYVYGRKVYYFINGRTPDGYTWPPPYDAGFVALVNGQNIVATGYDLYNNSPEMIFVNISNLEIKENKIWKSGVGAYVLFSENVYVKNNNFTNNSLYEIFITYSNYTNITKNLFYNTSGYSILLYRCDNNDIFLNNGTNSGYLISVAYANNSLAHDNYANYTSGGIWFSYSTYNKIYSNELWLVCGGQAVIGSSNVNYTFVFSNTGSSRCTSTHQFIYIVGTNPSPSWAYYGEVYNNTIKRYPGGVTWNSGIHINRAGYLVVHDNYIEDVRYSGNSVGIQFPYGAGHITYNNTVINASKCMRAFISNSETSNNTFRYCDIGITLEFATGNRIYNNMILDSITYGYDDYINGNWWSLGHINCSRGPNIIGGPCWGGNFYGNYSGCDSNGDGIGETSYPINGSAYAVDPYPLTNTPCKSQPPPIKEPTEIKPIQPSPKPLPAPSEKKDRKQNSTSISVNSTEISLPSSIPIH